ncbi:FAD-dependent oxidoreductase [Thermithiobacillus plumbiphilus]|uniref:FAD-dependent oxidoreductase n=1 Tax=Thermithiobacillus plumbiphilus TaxID=1729899 RepID=A0ABU9D9M4_9PROT
MQAISVWEGTGKRSDFPVLQGELQVDVAIVGGGITGVSAAMLLAQAGKRVALLEAGRIGSGTTGHSTGNLYGVVGQGLSKIASKWDEDTMRTVARSRMAAVELIEKTVQTHGIDCGFARRPWHLYTTPETTQENPMLEAEYEAARKAGLTATLVSDLPLPVPVDRVLRVDDQAQFHPLNYVRGLAASIASADCRILENSRVLEIDHGSGSLRTANGQVKAEQIVLATHSPLGIDVTQAEMKVYREYGVAVKLQDDKYPEGIFWAAGSGYSTRSWQDGEDKYLILVGGKHVTGHETETEHYYDELTNYLHAHYGVSEMAYRWSAQQYRPADLLPYIGPSLGAGNVYVATGFAADGLTFGTLAAVLISEEIMGRKTPWAELYKARRFTPVKSAREFLSENLSVSRHLIQDRLKQGEPGGLAALAVDEGALLELDGENVAAYRDQQGTLHALSPVCPHMKCLVHWNAAERSWDCPCHGSRFNFRGEVLEGPALSPLAPKSV